MAETEEEEVRPQFYILGLTNKLITNWDTISEDSYQPRISLSKIERTIILLTFDPYWFFTVCICNCITCFLELYSVVFSAKEISQNVLVLRITCITLIAVDSGFIIAHKFSKNVQKKTPHIPYNYVCIILNVSTTLLLVVKTFKDTHASIAIACPIFVVIRSTITIYQYNVYLLSKSEDRSVIIWSKYTLIVYVFLNLFASIWMGIALKMDHSQDWMHQSKIKYLHNNHREFDSFEHYIICIFYMMGAFCTMGYGGASHQNNLEQLYILVLTLFGTFMLKGCLLGRMVVLKYDEYKVYSEILYNSILIAKHVENHKLPAELNKEIKLSFAKSLGRSLGRDETDLFVNLPRCLQSQVYLDKYWFALNKSFLFCNASEALKREVANVMVTLTYSAGETIFGVGHNTMMMFFVAQGSVNVISPEDGESAVLTLGVGSCVGCRNLILTRMVRHRIKSATYTVVQALMKEALWRIPELQCREAGYSKLMHNNLKNKLDYARQGSENERKVNLERVCKKIPLEVDLWNKLCGDLYEDKPYLRSTTGESSSFVFLKTDWPWVLYPQSDFFTYWEFFLFGIICMVATIHPYYLSFGWSNDMPYLFRMFAVVVTVVFIVDVLLNLITAVQHDEGFETASGKIVVFRMKSIAFMLDVIAAIPMAMFCSLIYDLAEKDDADFLPVLQFNVLLKVVKVPNYLKKLENFYKLNMVVMRFVKYSFYVTFASYLIACVYYRIFCDTISNLCESDSFFGIYWNKQEIPAQFALFYYYAMNLLTGSELLGLRSLKEMHLLILTSIISVYMFTSINADFLATLCLTDFKKDEYESMLEGMQMYMNYCEMKEATQYRIHNFLTLQWIHFNGVDENAFLDEISKVLNNKINCHRFLEILDSVQLFRGLEPEVLKVVAEHCHTYFLPPEEFIVYEGQCVSDFFIIESGYCEVLCSTSHRIIKILQPKSSFCLLEMLLNKPSPFSYRAKTHVSVIKFNKDILYKKVFFLYTALKEQITHTTKYLSTSTIVDRVFTHKPGLFEFDETEKVLESSSWFVFPRNKRHPLYIDYYDNLRQSSSRFICEYFLMRRTVLPAGRFLSVYTILDRILIFFSIYYCLLMHFYRSYWDPIFYLSSIFDILGFLDIYLHFHFCYYNEKGILVCHPKRTAMNYLKTNFAVDLLSVIPFEKIIELEQGFYADTFATQMLITFNRVLKLYRFIVVDNGKPFVRTSFVIKLLHVISMVLLLLHVQSVVLLYNSTNIKKDGYETVVEIIPKSWLSKQSSILEYDGNPTFIMHINCLYWITMNMINGPVALESDFHEMFFVEVVITAVCSLSGYLLFTFLLGQMTRLHSKVNAKKLEYEIYIAEYKRFMKNQKIPMKLQKAITSYFDNLWKRTLGFNPMKVVTRCHDALKEDWVARFYIPLLETVPIFSEVAYQVAQSLGVHLEPKYYLENAIVINLNDLVDKVFIIWTGEVQIQDASKAVVEGLGEGSLFGNLDSVECTRSMVKVVVVKPVDLLCIDTLTFYKLLANIPYVRSRLHNHLILECLSYLKSDKEVGEAKCVFLDPDADVIQPWSFTRTISSVYVEWTFVICTYLSLLYTFFIVSFPEASVLRYAVFYTLDLIYEFQIVCDFFVREHEAFGLVRHRKYERKWYLKHRLPYNICAVFPFEVVAYIIWPERDFDYLKLNRILKVMRIVEFFKANFHRKLLVMNSLSIVSGLVLFIHSSACIVHVVVSLHDEDEPWIANSESGLPSRSVCGNQYFCCLYYATAVFTQTSFQDLQPHSTKGRICAIFLAIISCIMFYLFLGRVFLMVKLITYAIINFEYDRIQLQHYLSFSKISPQLTRNVLRYVNYLWIYRKGRQVPVYLERTPPHLKMALKASIFGKHIFSNPVFFDCHADFLRQLVGRFRIEVYFKNDLICQQGTINQTMYFIHTGRVRVWEADELESAQIDELCAPDSFGMIQGLFPCSAHNYTFEALEITTIVSLTFEDWKKLLIFFPAAHLAIYKNFQQLTQ